MRGMSKPFADSGGRVPFPALATATLAGAADAAFPCAPGRGSGIGAAPTGIPGGIAANEG